ncbi:MAG: hypothetical protein H7174_04560 [Flavobacterium sp.]|nr:hypothetical protein [Flavobacterium sp.]
MKKRLEAELISIAHRILKLKNHSELKQLHLETQKLYETLSVLKFVEENINIIQPKIDVLNVEQKLEQVFDKKLNNETVVLSKEIFDVVNNDTEPELKPDFDVVITTANEIILPETSHEIATEKQLKNIENSATANDEIPIDQETRENDETTETVVIIEENEPIFVPEIELEKAEIVQHYKKDKNEPVQISFDEFKFTEPVFEKKSDVKEPKPSILNEKLSKGINIGLNDKIAFVKHLFGDSNEDFNRVLSQISTFDTYLETVNFINDIVKPDYNNWNDKDEYVLRFMEAVEKKFV